VVYLTDDVIKSGMTSLKVGEAQSKSHDIANGTWRGIIPGFKKKCPIYRWDRVPFATGGSHLQMGAVRKR